jgi:hypothetical protein
MFRNDKMQGEGVMTTVNGQISVGNWENGRKHGLFMETNENGIQR